MSFHYIDIVVVVLIVLFGIKGAIRGLIREFFAMISIVAGVFLASHFALTVGGMIPLGAQSEAVIKMVGFAVTFAAVFGAMFLLGYIFNEYRFFKEKPKLADFVHSTGGAIIGAIKLFFILSIVVFAFSSTRQAGTFLQDKFGSSISFPLLKSVGSSIIKLDVVEKATEIRADAIKSVQESAKDIVEDISKSAEEALKGK